MVGDSSSIPPEDKPRSDAWLHLRRVGAPDGEYIACGSTGGQLELYEAKGLRPVPSSDHAELHDVCRVGCWIAP